MKTVKILLAALLSLAAVATAKAGDDKPVKFEQLPGKAQTFIKEHMAGLDISHAKMDDELFDRSYEVFFVSGLKVEFDKRGNWEKVESVSEKLPSGIVPQQITDYVSKNHPQQHVVKIERDRWDYEVELNNDTELKFDLDFRLIGYDD